MVGRMKLTNSDLLSILNSPDYAHIMRNFREKRVKKKDIIYPPNAEENLMFIVKKGKVRVYLAFYDKEFTLSILEEGDLYSTHTRAYTEAVEDCELLVCGIEKFTRIMEQYPTFTLTAIKVLGDILKNSFTIINGFAFKEVHQRLAELLVQMAEDKGENTDEGIIIELGLNNEQIAMLVGTSRQTVSILLNDLYKSGILVKISRRVVLIKNIQHLKKIASCY
ncbi:MAG TPA: Crp/Fnr family transcriptional regulator [Negativicutes bacterium]|jgi:CRP-like cAMP-binding protein|nr:Crp/Fnr family transcriptional regulator [Negativicutes bacterium]